MINYRGRHHRDLGQAYLLTGNRPPDDIGQVRRQHGHRNIEQHLFEQERQLGRQKGYADSLIVVEDAVEVFGAIDDHRCKRTQGQQPVEPAVELGEDLVFGIVDPHDAVVLHKEVPDLPH